MELCTEIERAINNASSDGKQQHVKRETTAGVRWPVGPFALVFAVVQEERVRLNI